MKQLDYSFLQHACDILADTDYGLTGMQIVKACNIYALEYNRIIPHDKYPFEARNKRTALLENLSAFEQTEQYRIITDICDYPAFSGSTKIKDLRLLLYQRYGNLSTDKISETELIVETKHWLSNFPNALDLYKSAVSKFEAHIFERNTLDDMRLSFELLVKDLTNSEKTLENQIELILQLLKNSGSTTELRNMFRSLMQYYTSFNNNHVKHNDSVNSNEIEYVIELTSVMMKYLIKVLSGDK